MTTFSPQWFSLREAARRLIRIENTSILIPQSLTEDANQIISQMVDHLPQRLHLPQIIPNDTLLTDEFLKPTSAPLNQVPLKGTVSGVIEICQDGEVIVRIGGDEPPIAACWIPTLKNNLIELWQVFIEHTDDLLHAGYPGCIGCAGPGAEEEWDEKVRRLRCLS